MIRQPLWLVWAKGELGVNERDGPGSNPRVIEYRSKARVSIIGEDSKIPWCAIFINAALEESGIRGTRSATARSFSRNHHFIKLTAPVVGCIVVFSSTRGPWSGHVGFYQGQSKGKITVISGNSNNKVTSGSYPLSRLVGYYWPRSIPIPDKGSPFPEKLINKETPSDL